MVDNLIVIDTGVRCFKAPCYNLELIDQDGKIIDVVSDVFLRVDGEWPGKNQPGLHNTVNGYVITFVHPQTGDEHKALVMLQEISR